MLAAYSTLLKKYLSLPLFYHLRHCYSHHLLPSAEGFEGLGIRAIIARNKKSTAMADGQHRIHPHLKSFLKISFGLECGFLGASALPLAISRLSIAQNS